MKTWNKKLLSGAVTGCMTLLTCSSLPITHASDIEIYRDATIGQPRIFLMLDTSGSMGISSLVLPKNNMYGSPGDVDAPLCEQKSIAERGSPANSFYSWIYNWVNPVTGKTAFKKSVIIGNTQIDYYMRGCSKVINGKTVQQYDRLSRLKDAIITLLADTSPNGLSNDVVMGLGHFSSKTELGVSEAKNKLVDSHSGRVLVPNAALNLAQRILIAQKIAEFKSLDPYSDEDGTYNSNLRISSENYPDVLKSSSGTPTVHAYAEAGAYMMGTTTGSDSSTKNLSKIKYIYDGYMVMQKIGSTDQVHFLCVALGPSLSSALGGSNNVKQCVNNWPSHSGTSVSSGTISNGVYKPNGNGGWDPVTASELATASGGMTNGWDTLKKFPVGWRYGGWMKVDNEPMDIEPIVGYGWGPYANSTAYGLVSYRTNPFALLEEANPTSQYTDNLIGGMRYSIPSSMLNGNYIKGGSTDSCDGNGIYFLTDGAPNSTKNKMAKAIMNHSLKDDSYKFTNLDTVLPSGVNILNSPQLRSGLFTGETGGWEYIGEYSKKLFDKTKNPASMSIRTAVVGFGSSFADLKDTKDCEAIKNANPTNYNKDAYNACKWGGDEYGAGGFYYAENVNDIQNSIINFVKKVEVNIDPVVTGSPSLPVDRLNPTKAQTEAYYATLEPNVQKPYQLWLGNLNKYRIMNGELYSSSSLQKLLTEAGTLNQIATGFWGGGTLGQLDLQHTDNKTNRIIYTNRSITGSGSGVIASSTYALKPVNLDAFFSSDANLGYLRNDPKKNYWLNALGYRVLETESITAIDQLAGKNELRQLGAVLHSTPILLTQEGKVNVDLTTTDRKDYLLYGSTQGMLHVVDVATGKEAFNFIPSEMIDRQGKAFLENTLTSGGTTNLFYGIDAPWTAHTQYVAKTDGTLTVGDSGRIANDESGTTITQDTLKGKQWVYGGLRMGGKSYYGLDLSDLNNPKLKLHIDPLAPNAKAELKMMGQSWSKPTLGYVNWGGQKKLVMFVGGGYDAEGLFTCPSDATKNNKGYECPKYKQTNKVGAGVYMFDAENGDLLWWSSATRPTGYDANIRFTENTDLQYSVASQINAIDRNGDGLIDHLYFGDLAGQAFRVDLNNSITVPNPNEVNSSEVIDAKNKFAKRTVTLFSEEKTNSDGLKPRFYEMPNVTIHTDPASGTRFAAIALSSGNRSSPLVGQNASPNDGVFVAFDKDVVKSDLYKDEYTLISQNMTLSDLVLQNGASFTGHGWRSYFSAVAGSYKGMSDIYAVDSMLYVSVYHKDGHGTNGQCGAGVRGDSYLFQYCLPFGKCAFDTTSPGKVNQVKIGVGILGTGMGQSFNNQADQISLVISKDNGNDCDRPENKHAPQCQSFDNSVRLKQLRWYETR